MIYSPTMKSIANFRFVNGFFFGSLESYFSVFLFRLRDKSLNFFYLSIVSILLIVFWILLVFFAVFYNFYTFIINCYDFSYILRFFFFFLSFPHLFLHIF